MRPTKPLRLAWVAAVAASAAFWLVYVANGIAYGSLVGLKGHEHDMQIMTSRGKSAVIVAVICQMLAWIMAGSAVRPADRAGTWNRLKPWVTAVLVSLISTWALMALFFFVNRMFRFV